MIVGSIDVIIQAERLRDGSRRITKITEVVGTEGEVVITQDLVTYEIQGEDETGRLKRQACRHRHRAPRFLGARPLLQSGARTGRRARQGQSMIIALAILLALWRWAAWRSPSPAATNARKSASPRWPSRRPGARRGRERQAERRPEAQECRRPAQGHGKEPAPRKKEKPTLRRRLEQAGFPNATPRSFWIICGILGVLAARRSAIVTHQTPLVIVLAVFAVGLGLPRWVLGFLTARRKKKFTDEFANAIDVIVRRSNRACPPTRRCASWRARNRPIRWAANSPAWSKA